MTSRTTRQTDEIEGSLKSIQTSDQSDPTGEP
jgi:hypothetical protein